MSSIRQQVVTAIITRLKTITVANEYNLAIGSKVYDWKLNALLPENLPAIEVRDTECSMELGDMSGGLINRLSITIVVLASGADSAAVVRSGLQDISLAMYTDRTFGGLVQGYVPESTSIDLQQEEHLIAAGQFTCSMMYYTGPGEI